MHFLQKVSDGGSERPEGASRAKDADSAARVSPMASQQSLPRFPQLALPKKKDSERPQGASRADDADSVP